MRQSNIIKANGGLRHGALPHGAQDTTQGLPLKWFCKEWVQHTSTFTFRSLILMRWKRKIYHPTSTSSSPLPFSCQTNLLTKSPLQHSLYTRQPIFGCLGEMDRLLPVSYNWEAVDEMGKKKREKEYGVEHCQIYFTRSLSFYQSHNGRSLTCYSQKDFFSP